MKTHDIQTYLNMFGSETITTFVYRSLQHCNLLYTVFYNALWKITHLEKKIKCVKFRTKPTHFEKKWYRPYLRTLIKNSKKLHGSLYFLYSKILKIIFNLERKLISSDVLLAILLIVYVHSSGFRINIAGIKLVMHHRNQFLRRFCRCFDTRFLWKLLFF